MNNQTETIVALENDGLAQLALVINCEILKDNISLQSAIRDATAEWVQTKSGQEEFHRNLDNFNWADFAQSVPNEICEKYGFRKTYAMADTIVDWNEQLVSPTLKRIIDTHHDYS